MDVNKAVIILILALAISLVTLCSMRVYSENNDQGLYPNKTLFTSDFSHKWCFWPGECINF